MTDNWIIYDIYLEPGKYLLRCEVLQTKRCDQNHN